MAGRGGRRTAPGRRAQSGPAAPLPVPLPSRGAVPGRSRCRSRSIDAGPVTPLPCRPLGTAPSCREVPPRLCRSRFTAPVPSGGGGWRRAARPVATAGRGSVRAAERIARRAGGRGAAAAGGSGQKQLLEKLRLRERPRLSHSVPRAAVARALRRLQAGGARRSPDVTEEEEEEQGYEIISFAEKGEYLTSPSGLGLRFQFSQAQDQDIRILQAQLWLYLRVPRPSLTLSIFLAGEAGAVAGGNRTLLGERRLSAAGSGWRSFPLLPALQSFFEGQSRTLRLELESRGDGSDVTASFNASWSHQPFLVAKVKLREPEHRVAKRSLRCSQNSNLCCRKDYYVDFRDIGWNDWIINPRPQHPVVGDSCCVPTRRRALVACCS
uniref:TGF-beta family profile domain-containing protein n=1 Tax=Malurus cyaneus samueli TaxID=2593467 RepID=A0A8C5U3E5_9PASS